MDVDFFVIDLRLNGASADLHASTLQNIKTALKDYAYIKACNPVKDIQVVSIIVCASEVEAILMPQKFNLIVFCKAIDQLGYEFTPENSKKISIHQGIAALDQAAKFLTQIKKKNPDKSLNVRISNFSSTWLPDCGTSNAIMKSLSENNAEVHFYHIEFPSTNFDEADDFTSFLTLSKWENCQLTRIECKWYSIQRAIKSLAAPPLMISSVKLIFSPQYYINCDLHKPMFDLSNIPQVEMCLCHGKRLPPSNTNSSTCSISGDVLTDDKISSAFQVGSLLIKMANVPKSKRIIELEIIRRVKVESLSDYLLYCQPFMVYSVELEYFALCHLLNERDEALLVTSFYDLETGNIKFMKQYFVLFPPHPPDSGVMLLKKVATEEHMKPLPPHKIFNKPTEENIQHVNKMLDSVECIDYNPLDFNGGLYASIENAMNKTTVPSRSDTERQRMQHITDSQANDNDNQQSAKKEKKKRLLHPLRKISLD